MAIGDHQQAAEGSQADAERLVGDIGAPNSSQSLAAISAGVSATTQRTTAGLNHRHAVEKADVVKEDTGGAERG
ncbi:hypothetical protein [Candidatus Accumulibacter sp. ACC007]|uniref:hypothetical protein n=1 Tax=Candidatus Accumulibacter sp. ACC007 TaxID=2823333 RepID=UPI0025B8EF8D|nr:hypothetical protein [Candidatus Accumulibacter sp. ACC007]